MKYTIDAKDKKLGRLATEAAAILMNKNKTSFRKERIDGALVEIINASKLDISEKKKKEKKYKRYSGYPGGLKEETLDHLISSKGASEALREAISGMLPKNKLRAIMLKNLEIKD